MPTGKLARVVLVRHGESEANTFEHIYIAGRDVDTKLTKRGMEQARSLGAFLRARDLTIGSFSAVYSSPAVRAFDTGKIVCAELGGSDKKMVANESLLEISQGDWERGVKQDLYTEETLRIMSANPYHFKAPGGESQQDVERRAMSFLNDVATPIARSDPRKRPVLIFTHGFVIKCVLRHVMDANPATTYRTLISNTSCTEFGRDEEGEWCLLRVNMHP